MARGLGCVDNQARAYSRSARPAQQRKTARFHIEDLSTFPEERLLLNALAVKAGRRGDWHFSDHALEACAEDHLRPLSKSEVVEAIKEGRVIEINDGNGKDCRLLVRKGGVCAVLSLGTKTVVTCWWNDPKDSHKSLDLSAYHRPVKSEASRRYLHKLIGRGVRMVAG